MSAIAGTIVRAAPIALALAAGLLAFGAPAEGRSVPPPPPHRPDRAACAIDALVAAIDRRDPALLASDLKIYSDRLGEVTEGELGSLFAEFAARGARQRTEPLSVGSWGMLRVNQTTPLYVITVRRGAGDGSHWSAWLVQFQSDRISSLRRADELWPFADGAHFFGHNCEQGGVNG